MDSTTETTSTKETALSLRALLTHRHLIASFAASVAMAATVGIFALGWIDKLADVPMSYDEARHAYHLTRTASLLASGQIAEFFSIGFEQITYPPGYSWLAAPVVLLTGTLPVTLRTLNLLWYLLAALTAWFAGSSLARFQPGLAGFISAGLVLTSAPLLLYASQGLLDSAGLLLVFITLYMYAKLRSNSSRVHAVGVGLLVAIAFAIKYPFGVFLGAGLSAATIIEHIRARRWRPERIALWMLASAALFVTAILMLPGRFSDAVWYNTLQIQNTELWSVDNLSYYGRSMVEQYSVSPLVGWAVVLAAGLALFLPHRRGSFRWAVFFWIGFIALTLKLENQPRHGYVVLPAAFVVAGPLIADGFDRVLRIFTGSVQRHSFHWGQLQFRFTTTTKIGHWQALGVVSVAAVLLVSSALINLQQRVDTFPILLALSYRADALAAQKIFGEVESGGNSNELYEFVSDSIDDLAPRVVILNTFNELNAPAIGWQLAHDRFGKAGTGTYIWPRHAYEGAPNDYAAFRARIISDQVEYIVFLRDARFGSPHWEQNGFTWNLEPASRSGACRYRQLRSHDRSGRRDDSPPARELPLQHSRTGRPHPWTIKILAARRGRVPLHTGRFYRHATPEFTCAVGSTTGRAELLAA